MRAFQSGEADRRPGNLDFVEGLNDPLRIAKYRDLAYGGSNRPALGVDAQPTAKHAETPGKQGGHIVIGQNEGGNPSAISDQPSATGFEEWGYAERAWYLEDRRGLSGILRALLWPTEGIVEVGRYDRVWAQRTPQPPSELLVFRVSDEGYRRLRRHLQTTITSLEPVARNGRAAFYPGAADRSDC